MTNHKMQTIMKRYISPTMRIYTLQTESAILNHSGYAADDTKETNEILTNKKGFGEEYNNCLWGQMDNGEVSK